MMFKKREYIICSCFIYFILILLIILLRDKKETDKTCGARLDSVCLRFCCENENTCSEYFIRRNLNDSLPLPGGPFRDSFQDFTILLGEPTCTLKEIPSLTGLEIIYVITFDLIGFI